MGRGVILPVPDPPLADELVALRPWRDSDLECVLEGTGLPPADGPAWIDRQQARAADGLGVSLAIVAAGGSGAVGYVGLLRRPRIETGPRAGAEGDLVFGSQPGRVGIGYWVLERARGRGIATRAVRLLSRWALERAGLVRVEALVDPRNEPSWRAVESAGFSREGLLRAYLELDGGPADALVYSLVGRDVAAG
jgi:ribosomal-protein-alanine N-acetyltransferase